MAKAIWKDSPTYLLWQILFIKGKEVDCNFAILLSTTIWLIFCSYFPANLSLLLPWTPETGSRGGGWGATQEQVPLLWYKNKTPVAWKISYQQEMFRNSDTVFLHLSIVKLRARMNMKRTFGHWNVYLDSFSGSFICKCWQNYLLNA